VGGKANQQDGQGETGNGTLHSGASVTGEERGQQISLWFLVFRACELS
jgi:hypothetical protein